MTENQSHKSPLARKICGRLSDMVHNRELTDIDMIDIADHLGAYMNLQTYSDYARRENITYNGVKDRIKSGKIKVADLFGVRFIVDNE